MTKPEDTTQAAGGSPLERGVGRPEPERDVLGELREAAARKWQGDPAAQRAGLFARAAAEIDRLRSTQDDAVTQTMLMWNAAWMELPESVRERCWADENPMLSGIRLLLARELTPNVRAKAPAKGASP